MSWHSFADFARMGGYGLYVWGAYGVTLVLLVAEALAVRRRHQLALAAARNFNEEETR